MARWIARLLIAVTAGGITGSLVAALLIEAAELGCFAHSGIRSPWPAGDLGTVIEFVWYGTVAGASVNGWVAIARRPSPTAPLSRPCRWLRTGGLLLTVGLGLAAAFAALTPAGRDCVGGLCSGKPLHWGRTASYWVEQLNDIDGGNRRYAILALKGIGPSATDDPRTVPALVKILDSGDDYDRVPAIEALFRFGARSEEAIPALVAVLFNSSMPNNDREWACAALTSIGPNGERALLNGVAVSRKPYDTLIVLTVIRRRPPDVGERLLGTPEVTAAVVKLMGGDNYDRVDVAYELKKFGRSAVPLLQVALAHPDAPVRETAAHVAGEIGPDAAATEPALSRLANQDEDPRVKAEAATALGKIRGERKGESVETPAAGKKATTDDSRETQEQLRERTPRALGIGAGLFAATGAICWLVGRMARPRRRTAAGGLGPGTGHG